MLLCVVDFPREASRKCWASGTFCTYLTLKSFPQRTFHKTSFLSETALGDSGLRELTLMTASFSLQLHSVTLAGLLLFTVFLCLPVVKLFCLKLLLSICNATIPCNNTESMILHVRLMGDSNTTRKGCGAGLGRCSGEGTGLTEQEVAFVPFTSYSICLVPSDRSLSTWLYHGITLSS